MLTINKKRFKEHFRRKMHNLYTQSIEEANNEEILNVLCCVIKDMISRDWEGSRLYQVKIKISNEDSYNEPNTAEYKNDKLINEGYLLSMKELNLSEDVRRLTPYVDSLKIEGRMKSPS